MVSIRNSNIKGISRILIANRGEISCRIQHTCHRLGIETVAVGSTIDQEALHMKMADKSVHMGPADCYLDADAMIEIALQNGVQGIHPGYGYLSENPDFAQHTRAAGLIFIGPPTKTIQAMGSKAKAKEIAKSVDVPIIPGYEGEGDLMSAADELGFPLFIKAIYGGGGKGMRRVDKSSDFEDALAACQREAKVAFGNEQVMLERYVRQPRHVEIQIIGDSFGKCMTLSDRDCSLQRRHQKVIEEAPAPDLSSSLRHQLHEAAVKIAQCVSYEGLGTVEFLVTDNDEFFFLEMNTRLQVEHPITEMILGLDLVELQLRVAAGEPLMLDQKNLQPHGHAVEARLYAEDGDNQFLPSTGTLTKLILPQGKDIRVDTGIREGDKITIHYDPLIAKVIAWGKNREDAYEKLKHALRETQISGIKTNLNFLTGLLTHPDVQKTAQDIEFLDRYIKQKAQQGVLEASDGSAWTQKDGWRLNIPAVQTTRRAELNYEESKHGGTAHLIAPMPGRVVCVLVALNEPVVVGQALMIIEAMKMEHTIRAPHEGIVYDLPFLAGDFCEEGVELVLLRGAI